MSCFRCGLLTVLIVALSGCGDAKDAPPTASAVQESVVAVERRPAESPTDDQQATAAINVRADEDAAPDNASAIIADVKLPDVTPERLILLTPAGPLICDLYVTLDGQSPYSAVDRLVDEILRDQGSTATTDGSDGQPTWQTLIESRPLHFGQFGNPALTNGADQKAAVRRFDRNRDGKVDPDELRRMLVAGVQGDDWLSLNSNDTSTGASPTATPTWQLLDIDHDGTLSTAELTAAPDRLKSRDLRGDESVSLAELSAMASPSTGPPGTAPTINPMAVTLSPRTNWEQLWRMLRTAYPGFRQATSGGGGLRAKELLDALDENQSGSISAEELAGLVKVPADLNVIAHFEAPGEADDRPVLAIEPTGTPNLWTTINIELASGEAQLTTPGMLLAWALVESVAENRNLTDIAAEQVRQYDKDGNGSLDRVETEQAAEPLKTFDAVDLDGDDKILPSELETFLARRQAVERSRFSVRVERGGDSLFAALDVNHDGRLGAREMAGATAQLLTCDANADGRITPDEVPDRTVVQVRHGAPADRGMQNESSDTPPARTRRGPVWFERMDTNGDGDLSPREFLGTAERFAELDVNHDAFIDSEEAERAGTK